MKDMIYRQDAIDAIVAHISDNIMPFPTQKGMMIAVKILENLPSEEPEIIRCKDCAYCVKSHIIGGYCADRDIFVTDDDYCSRAKRREE